MLLRPENSVALWGVQSFSTQNDRVQCVQIQPFYFRKEWARADAPTTGVYSISAWNVQRTGYSGRDRTQGIFLADVGQWDNTRWRRSCVPTAKNAIIGTSLIRPYRSRPSVWPEAVHRIDERGPLASLYKYSSKKNTLHLVSPRSPCALDVSRRL